MLLVDWLCEKWRLRRAERARGEASRQQVFAQLRRAGDRERRRIESIKRLKVQQKAEEYREKVKEEAYLLWEADGKPEGRDVYYWKLAVDKIEGKKISILYKPYYFLEKRILEPADKWISRQAFITIAAQLAILAAIIAFIGSENTRRNNEVFSAWQTITSANGQSGSGGRIEALEFLNSRPLKFPWIGWTEKGWYWDETEEKCKEKRLWGLRWERQPLVRLSASEGAYLEELKLCGADLGGANFKNATLKQANLENTNLEEANLQNAHLGEADLENADLRWANLENTNLGKANLQNANLKRANLENADLRWANLENTYLGEAKLENTNLKKAKLKNADLRWANLENSYLEQANLQNAYLGGAKLKNAYLGGAKLENAYLGGANLQDADLQEANLQNADLGAANLQDADLLGANLQNADLLGANLQGTYLGDANLQGTFLSKTKKLTPKQIKSTCFWERAIYKGDLKKNTWVGIEPDNTNFIEELKKDTASDPEEPPDCSRWENQK